ncbi:MAG: hypothetical protein J5985_00440 [Kiritimatiellae bacterium]|nr:hypothetical protein [Kiritimatiellia bacterium]
MNKPMENLDGIGPGCSFWFGLVSFILLALWQLSEARCGRAMRLPRCPLFQPPGGRVERGEVAGVGASRLPRRAEAGDGVGGLDHPAEAGRGLLHNLPEGHAGD